MNNDLTTHRDHEARLLADLHAANAGDETALKRLRRAIKGPAADEFIQFYGSLRDQVETNLLAVIEGKPGFQAMYRETTARLRNDLGWESASEMEGLLIDAVGIAWLDYHLAHLAFSQSRSAAHAVQDHYQKRLDRAHNRYLKSIKTLATVRKMALPALIALQADIHLSNSSALI